uniref:C2H2-type domain-containing protein n=1 Tax=Anopheles atroparvus TaxID=41427 RepID=A0AAG5D2Y2_ANOAO
MRMCYPSAQGGSSRRDYGGSGSSGVGGRGGGGSSSNRYHEGGSSGSGSYDKRGSHDHHSSTSGGGAGDGGSSRSKFEPHHRSSSSASRSHGGGGGDSGSSYRSRDNNSSSMGPPRSVAMRTSGGGSGSGGRSMMRPPMGDSSRMMGRGGSSSSLGGGSGIGGGIHRRGSMRGRISHYRSDGRRGMLSSRIIGGHHRRTDMGRPMSMHNRRYPSIRGRGELRSRIIGGIGSKRPLDISARKALIKRAIAAAKDLADDTASDNVDEEDEEEEEDDDEVGVVEEAGEPTPKKQRKTSEAVETASSTAKKDEDEDDEHEDNSAANKVKQEKDEKDVDLKATGGSVGDEQTATKKKVVKKETVGVKKEDSKAASTDDGSDKKRSTKITTKYRSSSFIKLTCAHCSYKCVTFKEYQTHLYSRGHKMKMRQLAVTCRERLLLMRAAQRNAQKDVDEKSEDGADGEEGGSKQRPGFCMLCRLNYRQPRATHQQSEAHKEMKNFLMPFCNVCKISFKSPMAYETHRASLDHLKIKARVMRYASPSKADDSGDELTGDLVDLDSLTIVDEVGKVDEICEPGVDKESSSVGGTGKQRDYESVARTVGTDDDEDEEDDEVNDGDEMPMVIGQEYVKLVEVQYCEVCNMYLHDRLETREQTLREHCKKPLHLKNYIRIRNDKKLRERAERIHKKKIKVDKGTTSAKKVDEKKTKESSTASGGGSAETKLSTTASATSADNGTASAGTTAATTAAVSGTEGGEGVTADKKQEANEPSSNSKSDAATVSKSASATTKGGAEEPTLATVSSEDALSLDTSKDADSASLGGDVNTSLIDDKLMWQVVDNDELGDLLRDVNEAEEEDDDKTSLERYDKFRHTEKNGLEQQTLAADGAGDEEEDSAETDVNKTAAGQVKAATNGDAENGSATKEKVDVV